MPRASTSSRPLFQRRQYEYIAAIFASIRANLDDRIDPTARPRLDQHIALFADRLERTNLHFNRPRFMRACGASEDR
jgi:hypothetical protein